MPTRQELLLQGLGKATRSSRVEARWRRLTLYSGIAIVACRERSQDLNGSPVNQVVLLTPLRLGGGFRGLIDRKLVSLILESRLPAVSRHVRADGRMHSRPIDDVIDP